MNDIEFKKKANEMIRVLNKGMRCLTSEECLQLSIEDMVKNFPKDKKFWIVSEISPVCTPFSSLEELSSLLDASANCACCSELSKNMVKH